jgi:hypothetical protein
LCFPRVWVLASICFFISNCCTPTSVNRLNTRSILSRIWSSFVFSFSASSSMITIFSRISDLSEMYGHVFETMNCILQNFICIIL